MFDLGSDCISWFVFRFCSFGRLRLIQTNTMFGSGKPIEHKCSLELPAPLQSEHFVRSGFQSEQNCSTFNLKQTLLCECPDQSEPSVRLSESQATCQRDSLELINHLPKLKLLIPTIFLSRHLHRYRN